MKHASKRNSLSRRRTRGFSLIELMVASTIGLIVTLAVTGSVMTMGRQFSVVASNVAAQGSAQIALSLLDAAGRSAGAGFYSNGQLVCPTWNAWNGSAIVSNGAVLMPARIVSGGSNAASDTVVFTGSAAERALSTLPVMANAAAGAVISVINAGGLELGDLALIGVPGSAQPCTLFQVTKVKVTDEPALSPGACGGNARSCLDLTRDVNASFNPPNGTFTNNPTFGFATGGSTFGPAAVNRLGPPEKGFRQDAFGVQCNALVRFNAFVNGTVPACTVNPLSFGTGVDAIATDVVQMHAQYGISNAASSDVVMAWVPATGTTWGGTPTIANVARIKAVRVILVTRSKEADGAQVSSACTNAGAVVNTGPCSFQDVDAPVIDLSTTTVVAGKTWRNYRYRVHQAVIPLRNVIWSDS